MSTWKKGKRIGKGGFCEVYEATREDDSEKYAQKRLPDGTDETVVTRFRREARILSELDHPNVVKVVAKRLDEPPYFFVMPLYDWSLEDVLPEAPKNEERLIRIFTAILDAVEYSHSEGILHRDLKPANILISDTLGVAVSDFGLGRDLTSDSDRQTETMQGLGSALYVPPEQYRGAKDVDQTADVFALGQILYAMLTGAPPASPDLAKVPSRFGIIIRKCTRPDPDNRYPSVTLLKAAWLATTRSVGTSNSPDKLRKLAADLASNDSASDTELKEFLRLVLQVQEDADLVKELVTTLPIQILERLHAIDDGSTIQLAKIFVDVVKDNSWPFSHTDVLARRCEELYELVSDAETKAQIIAAVLELGYAHNRWYVLGIFKGLMQADKVPGEEAYLYEQFEAASKAALQVGARYLEGVHVEEAISDLFAEELDED